MRELVSDDVNIAGNFICARTDMTAFNIDTTQPTPFVTPLTQVDDADQQTFNLMLQLLPADKNQPVPACVELVQGELEYEFIKTYFTHGFKSEVLRIEKIRNRSVQKKFLTELRLSCEKHKDQPLTTLVKLLFHGSKNTKPEDIYLGS
jgi:hypothetical protein